MPLLARPAGKINYHIAGSSGPALLLTHGYGETSALFGPNVASLAATHQVVTWDIRGHGNSECPPDASSYTVVSILQDMNALLTELGHARAVLGGHSLGGYLSLAFAIAFPERVAGLVLIDCGPGWKNDVARDGWNAQVHMTAARLETHGVAALADISEVPEGAHRDVRGLVLAARNMLPQHDAHVINGLTRIDSPALVVVGAEDIAFLPAADYMAAKIARARKVIIPAAGHAPNISQPSLFNAAVGSFLAELAGRSS